MTTEEMVALWGEIDRISRRGDHPAGTEMHDKEYSALRRKLIDELGNRYLIFNDGTRWKSLHIEGGMIVESLMPTHWSVLGRSGEMSHA